jgi:hypothetical protein
MLVKIALTKMFSGKFTNRVQIARNPSGMVSPKAAGSRESDGDEEIWRKMPGGACSVTDSSS